MNLLKRNKGLLLVILGAGIFCVNAKYADAATDYTTQQIGPITFVDGDTVTVTSTSVSIDSAIRDTTALGAGIQVPSNGKIIVNYNFTGSKETYGVYLQNSVSNNLGKGTIINTTTVTSRGFATYGTNLLNSGTTLNAEQLTITATGQGPVFGLSTGINAVANLGTGSRITANSNMTNAVGVRQLSGSSLTANQLTVNVHGATGATQGILMSAGNTQINLGADSIINATSGASSSGTLGINSIGQNDRLTANRLTINADATNSPNGEAFGLLFQGTAGSTTVDLGTGSSITVKSNSTINLIEGISARNNVTFVADHLSITNTAPSNSAIGVHLVGSNNNFNLGTNSSIIMNGAGTGVMVDGSGNLFKASGFTIANAQEAVYVSGGARVEITDGSRLEATLGGISIMNSGSVLLKDSQVILHSPVGYGTSGAFQSNGSAALIEAENVTITSDIGGHALGMWALNGGTIQGENMTIDLLNGDGIQAEDSGTLVNLSGDTTIRASMDSAIIFAKNDGQVTGTGKMNLQGDIYTANSGGVDFQMTSGSQFLGNADSWGPNGGIINLAMTDSQWQMGALNTGDSYVNNLTLSNSTVNIGGGTDYQTLNVSNLSGDGTFKMRTDLAAGEAGAAIGSGAMGTSGGDLLNVTGTIHSDFLLDIQNQGNAPSNSAYEHLVVQTADGSGNFGLTHNVEVGAYQYGLHRDSANSNNWSLFKTADLTPAADAALNEPRVGYYLNYAEIQTLMQRMGDLRENPDSAGNVWAKMIFGKNDVDRTSNLRGFEQTYSGIQAGVDKKTAWQSGNFYKGLFVGYTRGDQDYSTGSGDINSRYLGAYGTYISDNGFYIDGVLEAGWLEQSFRVADTAGAIVKADSSTQGAMASLEVGQRIHFDREKKQGFYLEPQAQINWGHQSGDSFTATNGLAVTLDDYNYLLGRIGFLAGYELKGGKNPINIYGKISYNHEFQGDYGSQMNGEVINGDLGDSWWSYGVGITAQISKKHNIYADIERASGGDFTQSWKIDVGYRFQW